MSYHALLAYPLTISLAILSRGAPSSLPLQDTVNDLPHLWRTSDAVALLRIRESEGPSVRIVGEAETALCVEHQAKVLEAFKRFIGEPQGQLNLLEPQPAAPAEPAGTGSGLACRPGEECVAFLYWNGFEQRFQAHLLLPVRDGKVTSGGVLELRSGVTIAALLTILRSFQE